ncbi:MAG: NAD-binding protein [Oscillospiraceae bacterium]|jgi:trk system potassium uptake protein TrkA|nr:NAD-binding protein [Oscillospiraceae bacterium]
MKITEKFIPKKKAKEQTIVVGCGSLGARIAAMLSDQNKNVVVIDINPGAQRKLPPSYGGIVASGDGKDMDTLEAAGIKEAACLITVTNDDDTNIMISQMAKVMFEVETVIARVKDTTKLVAFKGIDIKVISPLTLSINEFQKFIKGDIIEDNITTGKAEGEQK